MTICKRKILNFDESVITSGMCTYPHKKNIWDVKVGKKGEKKIKSGKFFFPSLLGGFFR